VVDTVIAGNRSLDEVNMPGAALINSESEYPKAGQRKPPTADTNRWSQESGEMKPFSNAPPADATKATTSIPNTIAFPAVLPMQERLLDAREVAARLGVSERWVRDHTTRRSPKIRAIKLGPLLRFRWSDVETFLAELDTARTSRGQRFGV
jgi:predicted DNA-binding transcriptional regulator AlpA